MHEPIRIGELEIRVVCQGVAPLELDAECPENDVDWAEERRRYPWAFEGADAWAWHVHAFAVATASGTVLIDTGLGGFPPYRPWSVEHDPVQAFRAASVDPAEVRHVVLTHLHSDHAGGVVTRDGEPAFPDAVVHVHRADWEFFRRADDPDDYSAWRAMGSIEAEGRLDLDPEDREIVPGLRVVHAPGHTPGHRSVLVGSDDTLALLTGDLLHLPIQVEHPEWPSSHDEDPAAAASSRTDLLRRASQAGWTVAVSHFAQSWGLVTRQGDARRWSAR